jgi:hypothetical protein
MKIEFENNQYEIDVERAIELGICKKARKEITDFNVGDVFEGQAGVRVLIIQSKFFADAYNIAGIYRVSLYSDFDEPLSANQIVDYLNHNEYEFVDNINKQIHELIVNAKAI